MMKRIVFNAPEDSEEITVRDLGQLRSEMIDDFTEYWQVGSGDGYIQFFVNIQLQSTLIIEPSIVVERIYVHFIDNLNGEDWLSVYDRENLEETIETVEEVYASAGLFLPLELAWKGIGEYVKTGRRTGQIDWITPKEMPQNGNW